MFNYQSTSDQTNKSEKTTAIPALQESFVKSSTEISSNVTDIVKTDNDIPDNRNVNNAGDVTKYDLTTSRTDDVTNNNDDVVGSKDVNTDMSIDTDLNQDMSVDADDVMTKDCNDVTKDDNSEIAKKNDDVMKNIDSLTDDVRNNQIELEDKLNSCKESKRNNTPTTDSTDRCHLRVKQDLRKIKTTVEFVEEDVRDIEGCDEEWNLNNSESEEEENWELEESSGDDGNIDNDIGDDIDNDIGDDIDNDIGDNIDNDIGDNIDNDIGDDIDIDNICNDGDNSDYGIGGDTDISNKIDDNNDDIDDENNDNQDEIKCKQAVNDNGTKSAIRKRNLSKGG